MASSANFSSSTWDVFPQLSAEQFKQLGTRTQYERIRAQLLYNRGIEETSRMRSFLEARYENLLDPSKLIDMDRAVTRIQQALAEREHITVYGDYDADGVTSSALLYRALRTLKHPEAPLSFHIPHRLNDGCGLNLHALDMLKARGTTLIITTDCASSDVEQVEYARTLGIDVIITDHHRPPEELPRAYAMVNPWRPDCEYGERYLCGAGIAFKLVQALYRAYRRPVEDAQDLLDLVAIGTVADIAPLLGENHTLTRLGLRKLNRTQKPGLLELVRRSTLQMGHIRERDIAFAIAPRINAAGRMKEASIAFDLLTTDDTHEATRIAAELDSLNQGRQQETEELMRNVRTQAQTQSELPVILVRGEDWHEGIIGLVAGKLAEEVQKPVLVLSDNHATSLSRGSARSPKDFNIIEALRGFDGTFERYGGHAQAAGFTLQQASIEKLHQHLIAWKENGGASVPAQIEGTQLPDQTGLVVESTQESEEIPLPPRMIDLEFNHLHLQDLNHELYKEIHQLAPFGAGNPEPVFKMKHLTIKSKWLSGREKQNLSLRLEQKGARIQLQGTFVRGAVHFESLREVTQVNIIFHLEVYEDSIGPSTRLKLLDIEPL
ncbi:single-stranded-DNA-specific exonuclease RecJ [Ktedonobacter sp. SOSP1-85]|uniref:single-stranded-DNA-specific exonuclease RecJ n=1 Tax=Ktedonobacter sp. SOSP1-85 TaxID=2778367 RepID=UPI0019165AED|nr:single-stranded-DNA-specific exonuclease RecJ [Ktedonobacter sp. SOSP1-85]GHO74712.1 single-stranded-DNA-specific exonuclease RecJ [Ktedonobacter sp. SOSP1-85]